MKITKTQLRKIIKEELNNVLNDERLNELFGFGKSKKAAADMMGAAQQAVSKRDQRAEQFLENFPVDKLKTDNIYILLNARERREVGAMRDGAAPVDVKADKAMYLKILLNRGIEIYEEKGADELKRTASHFSSFASDHTVGSKSERAAKHDLALIYAHVLKNMGAG